MGSNCIRIVEMIVVSIYHVKKEIDHDEICITIMNEYIFIHL